MVEKLRNITLSALFLTLLICGSAIGRMYEGQDMPKPYIIKGEVTVQFEDDVDLFSVNRMAKSFGSVSFNLPTFDATLHKFNVFNARSLFPWRTEKPAVNSGMHDLTRYYALECPEDVDIMALIDELNQNPNVRVAEPVWAMPLEKTPNDPEWGNQWAMNSPGPDPNFYTAWDYETGSDSIKFALIDSGILYNHSDLTGNIWVNPGEDLDGDGAVFDADDFDGIDNDDNSESSSPRFVESDSHSHCHPDRR